MENFFSWYEGNSDSFDKTWLILGKGPSFSDVNLYPLYNYNTIGLNHVVRNLELDFMHAIDIEVVLECGDDIKRNAKYLIMPWVPHIKISVKIIKQMEWFRAGRKTLEDYCKIIPVLEELNCQGRLLWYNLYTSPKSLLRPDTPSVNAYAFSSTAVVNLLAMNGVKKIRTLGVDGGNSYNESFSDLNDKTLLAAGQATYDLQFSEISKAILKYDLEFSPMNVESPIRIYVGTEPEQILAYKVLEYSIKSHASISVDIVPLFEALNKNKIDIKLPVSRSLQPRTPFSYQRFAIPALKNHLGRAIYLDSDMQVFRDIAELWNFPFNGADILSVPNHNNSNRLPQFSVMVLNCDQLKWEINDLLADLENGRWSYEQFMYEMAAADNIMAELPKGWNDLERFEEGETSLTHYTDMRSQPWLSTENTLGILWCQDLFNAISNGFIHKELVLEHIQKGWVRPSLAYQLEYGIVDPLLIPDNVKRNDVKKFIPPHIRGGFGPPRTLLGRSSRKIYAMLRNFYITSGIKGAYKRIRIK